MPILDKLKEKANGAADAAKNIEEAIELMNFGEGGDSGSDEFVVTIDTSGEEHTADKTFSEIFAAKQANKSVYMIYKGKKNHVVITSGSMGMFDGVASVFLGESNSGWATGIPVVIVKISDSDQVTETYKSLSYAS